MSTALKYAQQQLAATGFAILDATVAATLRPDLFNNGLEAAGLLGEAKRRGGYGSLLRVMTLHVTLEGVDRSADVLVRSADRLEERIEELTGFAVTSLDRQDISSGPQRRMRQEMKEYHAAAVAHRRAEIAREDELAKLSALAKQELPSHECARRREILKARRALASRGEAVSGFVPT